MKRILLFIALLLFNTPNSWATIALVANTCAGSSNGQNFTTSAINTTGATLIVIEFFYYNPGTAGTISDNQSNTWTALNTIGSGGNEPYGVMYYSANPTTNSSQTFTETIPASGTNYGAMCVLAFSGTSSSPFDQQNGAQGSGATLQPGSVTPSVNNEVVVSGFGMGSGNTASIDSSFTIPASNGQVAGVNGQNYGAAIAYLIQTTASAENPTWTQNSGTLTASIATFEASTAGATTQSTIHGSSAIHGLSTIH